MSRFSEWFNGHTSRGRPIFTTTRRRLTSMTVRGDQIAPKLNGTPIRSRFITEATARAAPAIFWIVEADLEQVRDFAQTPQVFDVINPLVDKPGFFETCRAFEYLMLNTESSVNYIGPPPEKPWKTFVVPHHHCNTANYRLPQSRIDAPKSVGYVGQPEHLHDTEAIQQHVERLGLRFVNAATTDLRAYQTFDIGVAWTRPEALRDETRSNIKAVNFASHGIPSVVCNYESYREVSRTIGQPANLIAPTLPDFLEDIERLVCDPNLRQSLANSRDAVYHAYSLDAIAAQYRAILAEVTRSAE